MFTLLPQTYKENLLKTYRIRLADVVAIFLLSLVGLGICLFLPTFIFIKSEHTKLIVQETALAESISKKNTDDFSKTLTRLKNDINLVSTADLTASPVIDAIEARATGGIVVQKIVYTVASNAHDFSLVLSGVASTRKILSNFAKELQTEKMFTSVELPISNLAKESNVPFTISIKGINTATK